MKKLFFCIALIFAVSMQMFAQSGSTKNVASLSSQDVNAIAQFALKVTENPNDLGLMAPIGTIAIDEATSSVYLKEGAGVKGWTQLPILNLDSSFNADGGSGGGSSTTGGGSTGGSGGGSGTTGGGSTGGSGGGSGTTGGGSTGGSGGGTGSTGSTASTGSTGGSGGGSGTTGGGSTGGGTGSTASTGTSGGGTGTSGGGGGTGTSGGGTGTSGGGGGTGTSGGGTGTSGGGGGSTGGSSGGTTGGGGGTTGTCVSPAPSVSDASVCQGQSVNLASLATGTSLLWYDNPSDLTGSTTAPTVNTSVAGTYMFYVSQTTAGCSESSLSEITVNVISSAGLFGVQQVVPSDGGISPFSYDQVEIVITGGSAPYNFEWDIEGYVRYDIDYTETGAIVTIFYTDSANWTVTVSDESTQCSSSGDLVFSDDTNGNTELNIDSYDVTADDGTGSGGVDIAVSGGCGPYTYEWSNGATTQDISGLATGWYYVVVTGCNGEQAVGWYWVPSERRGRKTDMDISMNAYPNPANEATTIEFISSESGNADVSVFDLSGKAVANVYKGEVVAGQVYKAPFSVGNLPVGMYIVKLTTDSGMVQTSKLNVAR